MKFYTTPSVVQYFFPRCTWSIPSHEKIIYLTFDDGPIPEHTASILKTLEKFDAKATFFCVGDNIRKFPEIARDILDQGHVIGNHTFHHVKAWSTKRSEYLNEVELFESEFQAKFGTEKRSALFRPPHGQLTFPLYRQIKEKGYEIVMWNVLSYDFDPTINRNKVMEILKQQTRKGSIVVFHDNYKAEANLKELLPGFLQHFQKEGYAFHALQKRLFINL